MNTHTHTQSIYIYIYGDCFFDALMLMHSSPSSKRQRAGLRKNPYTHRYFLAIMGPSFLLSEKYSAPTLAALL